MQIGQQAPLKAARYVELLYRGGPVLSCPELVPFYWGAFDQSEIDAMQAWLHGYVDYVSGIGAPEGQECVLRQYGVFGATLAAWHQETTTPASMNGDGDAEVFAKLQALQSAGALPAFTAARLFLVFTKGIDFPDYRNKSFAWHHGWSAGQYYSLCPYPAASADPIAEWQGLVSHEILEAATDPLLGHGWLQLGAEGADVCGHAAAMPFGTVVDFADNASRSCSVWSESQAASLAATSWGPDRIDLFGRAADGSVAHKAFDGSQWTEWKSLGLRVFGAPDLQGHIIGTPQAVSWGPGRIDLFARTPAGLVLHNTWDQGPDFTGWTSRGGIVAGSPVPIALGPNRLHVFAEGVNGNLWHLSGDGTNWNGWQDLGGPIIGPPAVAASADNRIDIFVARSTDAQLMHLQGDGSTSWARQELGGQTVGLVAVAQPAPGRLDVFARGIDGALWHTKGNGNGFESWESLGGPIVGSPASLAQETGRADILVRGPSRDVWHCGWDGQSFGDLVNLGGEIIGSPLATSWGPDRLDVFGVGADGVVWQGSGIPPQRGRPGLPGGFTYNSWIPLGAPPAAPERPSPQ